MATITKTIYCAQCRTDTAQELTLDKNREIVATCGACTRSIKFPVTNTPAELDALIAAHKGNSKGQVTVQMASDAQKVHDAAFLKSVGASK